MIDLTATEIEIIISALVALATTLYGLVKNREAKVITEAFIPGTPASESPVVVDMLPPRSWKMDGATKRWLTFDATEANRESILRQIAEAESEKRVTYQIQFDGGFYDIEYGLLRGGAGNPSGIKTG